MRAYICIWQTLLSLSIRHSRNKKQNTLTVHQKLHYLEKHVSILKQLTYLFFFSTFDQNQGISLVHLHI